MMQVAFHTGVSDKVGYGCRLLRKAYRSGSRVIVTAPPAVLGALDRVLWTFEAAEFVPHVLQKDPSAALPARLAATPVWLAAPGVEPVHHDVLVNFGPDLVPGFESFKRVIELISTAPDDMQEGRRRWKHYVERGYALTHHQAS